MSARSNGQSCWRSNRLLREDITIFEGLNRLSEKEIKMKRIIACLLLITGFLVAEGQPTGVYQDFNSVCATTSGFPADWMSYNPLPVTIPEGQWVCAPGLGRYGTNGIKCTGVWGSPGVYHLDTAFLITYGMDLHDYPDDVYINFDTKVSNINLGARLALMVTNDSTKLDSLSGATNITGLMSPTFGNDDSTDWVTHTAKLTPFKGSHPLYVAFRYTSTTSAGSTWFIDNVYTSRFPANVNDVERESLSLNVLGNSTSSVINLACKGGTPGTYRLCIYDVMGRQVHTGEMAVRDTQNNYTIGGLDLAPGMYIIKLSGGSSSVAVRTIVR